MSFLVSSAQAIASLLPFSTSIANQITREAKRQSTNKKGKPCQLLPVWSIIDWITFGAIVEAARFESPKRLKNWISRSVTRLIDARDIHKHHVIITWRSQLSHHRLRPGLIWRLEQT